MNGSLVEKCMEGFNKTVYMTKTVDKYICVFKFLIIYFATLIDYGGCICPFNTDM